MPPVKAGDFVLENLLTEWSRLLFGSLAQAGVTEVVLSPGSRSTPFMVAAARTKGLRCHDVIDERAAAFLALGQARWSGRPSVLVCTSGSAAAHYFPAIVEARLARIPMLVVTADRPLELQDCGASQTIDQIKMFGGYVQRFFELGLPDPSVGSLRALQRLASQATFHAMWPEAGAVHLNVRARKPLEPCDASTPEESALASTVDALLERGAPPPRPPLSSPHPVAIAELAGLCARSRAGLIICGPSSVETVQAREAVLQLAQLTGFPLLCEATSQLRLFDLDNSSRGITICDAFDWLLKSQRFRHEHPPDLVIQIGATPVSGAWDQYVDSHQAARAVLSPIGWCDPQSNSPLFVHGDLRTTIDALCNALPAPNVVNALEHWRRGFAQSNEMAWQVVNRTLDTQTGSLSEAVAVRTVVSALPRASVLVLGNSLPIRHVDNYSRQGASDVVVLSQRGANGIDGIIAGAVGSAGIHGRTTTVLIGDVSFLHDLTALMLARTVSAAFVVVVINNGGGRIFETLPLGSAKVVDDDVLRHVLTPHEIQFGHAAQLFGLEYSRVSSNDELTVALDEAYARSACTVIECTVAPHGAVEMERRIRTALETELSAPSQT